MIEVEFQDYNSDSYEPKRVEVKDNKINSINVGYDGGRFSLYINGSEIDLTSYASTDWSLDINLLKDKETN